MGKLGGKAVFECEITKENAKPHWLKDGLDIRPDAKYDMDVDARNYRLTVNDIDSPDAGDYAIVVKGHRSAARLQVEVKPEFLIDERFEKPLVLRLGESVAVEVPFTGSPQPKVAWRKDGGHILENRRLHIDSIHNMTSLVIGRAAMDDAGTYTLHLNNPFGSSKLTIQVIVLGKDCCLIIGITIRYGYFHFHLH